MHHEAKVVLAKQRESPVLPPGFEGIMLSINAARSNASEPLWLHGAIQLREDQARSVGVVPVQRAVVLSITSGLSYRTWNLMGEQIAFRDDQEQVGGFVRAYFSVDLSREPLLNPKERSFIVGSVGACVSQVVEVAPK